MYIETLQRIYAQILAINLERILRYYQWATIVTQYVGEKELRRNVQ